MTKARLDMLAMNQSRNSSQVLESRIQALNDHYHHMSQDLEHLKEWSRKLEKKNKRLEGRLALMERNLRENRRHAQKQKPDLSEEFFNLTLEFQSQEERLGALQVQRDELLVGLKGLQESLENQALRVTRLEERLSEVLQWNGGGSLRGSGRVGETLSSNITPQKYDNPHRRSEEEEDSDTKVKSAMIHNLLQLPVRHKIPAKPVPKKNANICNVDSMLIFPSASAENYVSFFLTLPDLPEFSVCLWLRVEASHVGTLLSYATHDNDNQVVLFGRNSSSASSPSLDFVIGDTVYRRLPVSSLLDAHWHHLCVLWSSIQGRFWYYNDRHLTSSGSNFRKGWEIPGGGSVVLGQEQDSVGGGFDPAEGFAGQMAGFRVWNRVLSPSEVKGVAEGRGVPRGVVLCMEDIKEVHGEVQQVACECLEHCV
uniref:Pentraxin 4 n=1 Tax=Mastacembelus armatus TaxID=205130 RepID=A0A3Q3KZJ8_9TELE